MNMYIHIFFFLLACIFNRDEFLSFMIIPIMTKAFLLSKEINLFNASVIMKMF